MQRQKNSLFQMGLGIVILGIVVKAAIVIGLILNPIAWWAIVIGAILMVIGLVTPGRSSYYIMNRVGFQQISEERLQDAEALLNAGRWSAAYYMAGYSVEYGLNAVIARRTVADDFPAKDAAKLYTHNLRELLGFAGLGTANGAITTPGASVRCSTFWETVKLRKEIARYESKSQQQAEELIQAINDPIDGVLVWIRIHW